MQRIQRQRPLEGLQGCWIIAPVTLALPMPDQRLKEKIVQLFTVSRQPASIQVGEQVSMIQFGGSPQSIFPLSITRREQPGPFDITLKCQRVTPDVHAWVE